MTEETITKEKTTPRELGECPVCGGNVKQNRTHRSGKCKICGKEHKTYYYCENGCDFCDTCYGSYAFFKLGSIVKTKSKNPIDILNEMMSDTNFGLRGCVHCAAAPLSIVLAYKNAAEITRRADLLMDLFKFEIARTPISMCKINGHCGIPISSGNSLSALLPILDERYENSTVGKRLKVECIKAVEGIRYENTCCKKVAYLEITVITDFVNRYMWVHLPLPDVIKCKFSENNPYCEKENCEYYEGLRIKPLNDLI